MDRQKECLESFLRHSEAIMPPDSLCLEIHHFLDQSCLVFLLILTALASHIGCILLQIKRKGQPNRGHANG